MAIRKILVRAPNWIGDAVMCLPALDELKKLHPDAAMTVLANRRVAPLFENRPSVSEIRLYDFASAFRGATRKLKLALALEEQNYDMAVLFQNAFEAALIARLAGIPERVGYARDLRRMLLTKPIKASAGIKKQHQVFYYLDIVTKLGGREFSGDAPTPELTLSESERERAVKFLKAKGIGPAVKIIGVAPGASFGPAKRWPPEKFAEAIGRIIRVAGYGDAVVLIFGGKDDSGPAAEVEARLKARGVNLAGRLPLRESLALVSMASVFVTNDSGLMHAASALGAPTIAIFGSTDPVLTGPLGKAVKVIRRDVECSPCFERKCRHGHYDCLALVEPSEVAAAAKEMLSAFVAANRPASVANV
jgi:heptosyltransferase-2